MVERAQGGCVRCASKKRRCDRKSPRCSLCVKHGEECELQTFRNWTKSQSPGKTSIPRTRNRTSRAKPNTTATRLPSPSTGPSQPYFLSHNHSCHASFHDITRDKSYGVLSTAIDYIPMHSNPALDPNWHPGFQIMTNDGAVEADVSLCSLPDELFVDEWSLTASALEYSMTTPIGDDEYTGSPLSIELGITPDADTGANPSSLSTLSSVIELMALTYCPMPWPSDMLQSPQRRFLWHYFIQTASTGLLCLEQDDMRRVPDFCDPFTTILPTMALAHEPLRATVYCLAAAHQQPSIGQDVYHNLTRSASLMVTNAFKSLTPGAHHQDDFTVAVTIVAGIFLKLAGEETGHGHLKSAIMLTAQFLRKSRSWTRLSAPYIQMTLALLRWCVISSAYSLQPDLDIVSDDLYSIIEICPDELHHNYSSTFRSWTVHPLYAFSQNLINPLLQMGSILNIRKRVNSESTGLCPSHEYENNGLEEALTDAFKKDLMSLSATADSLRLHCLNESMYAAASILFYTRVKKLPLTAPLVRQQVQVVLDKLSKLGATQRVKGATLFPLFVSGCEAVDEQLRGRILNMLRSIESTFAHIDETISALQHIWLVRDLQPGLVWPQWTSQMDLKYRISILF